jgi:hypothetical protein
VSKFKVVRSKRRQRKLAAEFTHEKETLNELDSRSEVHPVELAGAIYACARLSVMLGASEEALSLTERLLSFSDEMFEAGSATIFTAYEMLAICASLLRDERRFEKARQLDLKVLRFHELWVDPDDLSLLWDWRRIAEDCAGLHNWEAAGLALEKAMAISIRRGGYWNRSYWSVAKQMGHYRGRQRRNAEKMSS